VQCTKSAPDRDLFNTFRPAPESRARDIGEPRLGPGIREIQHFPTNPATTGRFHWQGMCTITGPHDMIFSMVKDQPIVSRNSDVMGGTAVFHGTRVPVQTLLDYLEAGESIDDFLDGFPSVTREQVIAFLEEAKDRVIEAAS
jgi:uncharacterized protein (DUF433 family)